MAANPETTRIAAPYAPTWDKNPTVLVSRRNRVVPYPTALLLRELTDADRKALEVPLELGKHRDESFMTIGAGVNFLGAFTTAWDPLMFRAGSHRDAPKSAPPTDRCVVVAPYSHNINLDTRVGFVDPDTKLLKPEAVRAAWMRVLVWMQAREEAQTAQYGQPNVPLFAPEQGYDAPEWLLLPLSEVLNPGTTLAGTYAYDHVSRAIPHAKDGSHLGALHDYAARSPSAWNLVIACRARAQQIPGLTRRA